MTVKWLGNAVNTKDVWTITVANTWATADTGTVTINGKDLVVTIGSLTTTAQVATSIKEAWESASFTDTTASKIPQGGGTSIPEMSELTATVSGSTVVLTADTAGVPHTISVSENTAGTGTLAIAHTVTATGSNYWDNVDNWDTGSVPVSTDDVVIDQPVSILYGLAQSAVTLTSLTITERFTTSAKIGLPFRNAGGYSEYRATELAISSTTITCRGSSSLIKINVGTAQMTCNVYSTGVSAETGRGAFQIRGTHASNVVNHYGGAVSFAGQDETATVLTYRQEGGTAVIGKTVTLATLNKLNGTAYVYCAATTINNVAGSLYCYQGSVTTTNIYDGSVTFVGGNTGTLALVNQSGGTLIVPSSMVFTTLNKVGGSATCYCAVVTVTNEGGGLILDTGNTTTLTIVHGAVSYNGTGTIGTLVMSNESILNTDGNVAAMTITNSTLNDRAQIIDKANRIAFTNMFSRSGGRIMVMPA